jgi:hypothetical protein
LLSQTGVVPEQLELSRQATHWPALPPTGAHKGVADERDAQAASSPVPLQARQAPSAPQIGVADGQSVAALAGVHPDDMSTPPSLAGTHT